MNNDKKGILITFEGGDGSGKSTQLEILYNYLSGKGQRVKQLREPGGTPIGEEIRHLLKNSVMCPETELLLLNSSRAQLCNEVIRHSIAAGEILLCDRFYDSSIAYQGYGRGLPLEAINQIIDFATGGLKPDLTFFIDLSPESAMEITRKRNAATGMRDRYDEADIAFCQKVYRGYSAIAAKEPERFRVIPYISGDDGIRETQERIRDEVERLIKKREAEEG